VLPVPRVPDGLTIAQSHTEPAGHRGTTAYMPDNGIVERLHKTMLHEFYQVAFRKKVYQGIGDLQRDLDA
jgi:hypothetical protein